MKKYFKIFFSKETSFRMWSQKIESFFDEKRENRELKVMRCVIYEQVKQA